MRSWRKSGPRKRHRREGAAALEFAFVALPFFVMIFAMLELGMAFVLDSMLENAASEQGSRMTAMDNATRNAGDMINRLSIQYNRTRQAAITTELVEIISGAEAL